MHNCRHRGYRAAYPHPFRRVSSRAPHYFHRYSHLSSIFTAIFLVTISILLPSCTTAPADPPLPSESPTSPPQSDQTPAPEEERPPDEEPEPPLEADNSQDSPTAASMFIPSLPPTAPLSPLLPLPTPPNLPLPAQPSIIDTAILGAEPFGTDTDNIDNTDDADDDDDDAAIPPISEGIDDPSDTSPPAVDLAALTEELPVEAAAPPSPPPANVPTAAPASTSESTTSASAPLPVSTADPTAAALPADALDTPILLGTLVVPLGSTFTFRLPGTAWIFLGEQNMKTALLGITPADTDTEFRFQALELGDTVIDFQYQDLLEQIVHEYALPIEIVSPDDPRADAGPYLLTLPDLNDLPADAADPAIEDPFAAAKLLHDQGFLAPALQEYLDAYTGDDPETIEIIAALATQLGDYETAIQYWEQNLNADMPYDAAARTNLIAILHQRGDLQRLTELIPLMLQHGDIIDEAIMLDLAASALETENGDDAMFYLDYIEKNYSGSANADRYHYLYAQAFENQRGIPAAIEQYRIIVDTYPFSPYWEAAAQRLRYLERHFIDIR